ncbi:MAG: hypothetical protein NZ827_00665 [Aquificaceae bacterium]|nr:hypothetical protein [Aquificaceae bacterium]MCS7195769.1 hypothetical protein [Aquificaceae bacterium]MDW8294116.1 hypothetical protein [Aquificaceae bacterium]
MLLTVILLIIFSMSFSKDFCISGIENPYPEPFLDYLLRKHTEKAILERGYGLRCDGDAEDIKPAVELLRETPIAYTPQQRVSAYNLELKVSLTLGKDKRTFSTIVSYSQPEGGLGDLPRRSALQDAMGIIYIDMLDFIGRR